MITYVIVEVVSTNIHVEHLQILKNIKGNDEIHSPQRNWAMKGW